MPKAFRRTALLLTLAALLSLFSPAAHAVRLPFTDVTPSDWCFEQVSVLTERGVLTGYPDGAFRPEAAVSVAEAVAVLERLFGDADAAPEDWDWSRYESDWFTGGDLGLSLTRGHAAKLILAILGASPLPADLLDSKGIADWEAVAADPYADCFVTAIGLGFFHGDGDGRFYPGETLTRAEFCSLLLNVEAAQADILPEAVLLSAAPLAVPLAVSGFSPEDTAATAALAREALSRLPEELLELYALWGWSFVVAEDEYYNNYISEHYKTDRYSDSKGIYMPDSQTIMLRGDADIDALRHELGHFVYYYCSDPSTAEQMAGLEGDALAELWGRDYCLANTSEFFAEAFRAYLGCPEALEAACPLSFRHICELMTALESAG